MRPFFVLGTPRSRTAWLAEFLSTPGRPCVHEPSRHWGSVDDLLAAVWHPEAAISDSMLTLRWQDLAAVGFYPQIVVVRRPLLEVVESFENIGLGHPRLWASLCRVNNAIDDMLRVLPALVVPFGAMADRGVCGEIYEHCLGAEMPDGLWQRLARKNIQADVQKMLADARENLEGIQRVFPEMREAV